jgi:hypothetical protein
VELAPYRKFLYSPDAFGLPELYYLGAVLFHRALSDFLAAGLQEDLYTERTVTRLTMMLCAGKRQTCLPARRPEVTAVSAGAAGVTPAPLRLG